MPDVTKMMEWHVVPTQTEYDAGSKVEEYIYFIEDSKKIMRGSADYTAAIRTFEMGENNAMPNPHAKNVLYIEKNTLAGYVDFGDGFVNVIKPPVVIDKAITEENKASENAVSTKAVVEYLAAELKKISDTAVKTLSYDEVEHIITVTTGDKNETTFVLNGLGCNLSFNRATGELQLVDASGTEIGDAINLDLERFVLDAYYDSDAKELVIAFNDSDKILPSGEYTYPDTMPTTEGNTNAYVKVDEVWYICNAETGWELAEDVPSQPIRINVADLVDTYDVESSDSVKLTMLNNTIKAAVNISKEADNALVVKADGLYVPLTKGGSTVYTGASIDEAVGDATPINGDFCIVTTTTPSETEGEPAITETTIYIYADKWISMGGGTAAGGLTSDMIAKYGHIANDAETASDDLVVSEKALVGALSWKHGM